MQYKITRLKQRGPRKGETFGVRGSQSHGTSGDVQSIRTGDGTHEMTSRGRSQGSGDRCCGGGLTLNAVGGIGKKMVADLDSGKRRFAVQVKADRKAAALDRLAGL